MQPTCLQDQQGVRRFKGHLHPGKQRRRPPFGMRLPTVAMVRASPQPERLLPPVRLFARPKKIPRTRVAKNELETIPHNYITFSRCEQSAEGGTRTHTPLRIPDFESSASAIPPLRLFLQPFGGRRRETMNHAPRGINRRFRFHSTKSVSPRKPPSEIKRPFGIPGSPSGHSDHAAGQMKRSHTPEFSTDRRLCNLQASVDIVAAANPPW